MRRAMWLLVFAALFLSLAASQGEKSYGAERFDVTAEVEPGGSLRVQETVVFHFQGGPFTFVFREVPTDFSDGVVDLVATIDGRILPEGDGPGQVEIRRGNPIRVTWHMEPTSNTAREFGLAYRMLGVVRQTPEADLLRWRPLPTEYEYAIGSSQVAVTYPPEWSLAGQPTAEEGQATAAAEPGRAIFRATNLGPNEGLLVNVPFKTGSVISQPPAWQVEQQAAAERQAALKEAQNGRAWIWIGLSGLALMGGTALLWQALSAYRRPAEKRPGLTYSPPDDLRPAVAGTLRSQGGSVTWEQAQGTLFDLAGRGYLAIEQLPKRRWRGHDFLIRRLASADELRPHETGLMELLLNDKNGRGHDSVKLSSLNNIISSKRWKAWSEGLQDELTAEGLLDAARKKARARTMALALLPMGLALVVALVMVLRFSAFGWWPLFLAGALLIVAIIWLIGGASISALSDEGVTRAAEWEPFHRYLKAVSQGKAAPANEDEFEGYLPYAAAYGLLHSWAKRFEKRGWKQTPAYFRPLSDAGRPAMSMFVILAATTSSSGGSASSGAAGAAGAGGAAGGGASGAG